MQLSGVMLAADFSLLSLLTPEDRAAVGQDEWIVTADPHSCAKRAAGVTGCDRSHHGRRASRGRRNGAWLSLWPVLFGDRILPETVQSCPVLDVNLDDEAGVAMPPVPGIIEYEAFFRSSFPAVRRAMWAITQDWALAEDVTQEAMVIALGHWDVVAEHPEPLGWVIITARNIAFRVMRRIRKAQPDSPVIDRLAPYAASGNLDPTKRTDARLDLMEALRSLPLQQRECVVLVHLLGYRIKDAADMMQIAEGTVKAHLHTARRALRGLLSFNEGDAL